MMRSGLQSIVYVWDSEELTDNSSEELTDNGVKEFTYNDSE